MDRQGYQQLSSELTAEELKTVPADTSNRMALALGYYMQRVYVLIPVALVALVSLLAGVVHLATKGTVTYEVIGTADVVNGALACVLMWLVWNSPYDMLKKLREALIDTMQNNKRTALENQRFQQSNEALGAQVRIITEQNDRQDKLNETLAKQVNTYQVFCAGQQKTLGALTGSLSDQTTALGQVMQTLKDHVSVDVDKLHGTVNSFYSTLTGLGEVTQQNQLLARQLAKAVNQMDDLLDQVRDDVFNRRIEEIVLQMDEIADGPDGLRQVLAGKDVRLEPETSRNLLSLLTRIDTMLREKLERAHTNDKSRAIPSTRTIISDARELLRDFVVDITHD